MVTTQLIQDSQSLVSATDKSCYYETSVKTYDDGFGPLWVYIDSLGPWLMVTGIVRAQTWHDAYEVVLDEILTPLTQDEVDDMMQEAKDDGHDFEDGLPEGYEYMPNSYGASGIVSIDVGNESLNELTPELALELEITVNVEDVD